MGSIITVTDHDHGILDNIIEGEVNTDELEKDTSDKDRELEKDTSDKHRELEKDTSDKDQEFRSKVDETDSSDELNNATCISDSGKY